MMCKLLALLTVISSAVLLTLAATGRVPAGAAMAYIGIVAVAQVALDVIRTRARIREGVSRGR